MRRKKLLLTSLLMVIIATACGPKPTLSADEHVKNVNATLAAMGEPTVAWPPTPLPSATAIPTDFSFKMVMLPPETTMGASGYVKIRISRDTTINVNYDWAKKHGVIIETTSAIILYAKFVSSEGDANCDAHPKGALEMNNDVLWILDDGAIVMPIKITVMGSTNYTYEGVSAEWCSYQP